MIKLELLAQDLIIFFICFQQQEDASSGKEQAMA
jgi:hypothetical protein